MTSSTPDRQHPRCSIHWLCSWGEPSPDIVRALRQKVSRLVIAPVEFALVQAQSGDTIVLLDPDAGVAVETAEQLASSDVTLVVVSYRYKAFMRAFATPYAGALAVVVPPGELSWLDSAMLRLRDIGIATIAGAAALPIIGLLGAIVRATSPGPMFFTTQVTGRYGVPFTWRKLRSMLQVPPEREEWRKQRYAEFIRGAMPQAGPDGNVKIVDHQRITPIGRFMRKHSLDELPQLWNVIKGDMSLVGPRPAQLWEWDLHEGWHRLRFQVSPGLTGPWQAFGRSRVSFDEMALMDYFYSRLRSPALDMRIIWKTIHVIITGEGAL